MTATGPSEEPAENDPPERRRDAKLLVRFLDHLAVHPGERVVLALEPGDDLATFRLACRLGGREAVVLDPDLAEPDLARRLRQAAGSLVVAEDRLIPVIGWLTAGAAKPPHRLHQRYIRAARAAAARAPARPGEPA